MKKLIIAGLLTLSLGFCSVGNAQIKEAVTPEQYIESLQAERVTLIDTIIMHRAIIIACSIHVDRLSGKFISKQNYVEVFMAYSLKLYPKGIDHFDGVTDAVDWENVFGELLLGFITIEFMEERI